MARGKAMDDKSAEAVEAIVETPEPPVDTMQALMALVAMLGDKLDPEKQATAHAAAMKGKHTMSPGISPLNPQGDREYPRPRPKYRKMFIPHETEWEQLSFEELELVDRLVPGEYTVARNDGTTVPMTVSVETNSATGAPERLDITHDFAYREDQKLLMPGLASMFRDLLAQAEVDTSDIMTLAARQAAVDAGELPKSVGV